MTDLKLPELPNREAFERWINEELDFPGIFDRDSFGDYRNKAIDLKWCVWQHAYARAAVELNAAQGEAVGTLSIQSFRGHLENQSFDYYGDLPDGDYRLYAHPPSADFRAVCEALGRKWRVLADTPNNGIADDYNAGQKWAYGVAAAELESALALPSVRAAIGGGEDAKA